MRKLLFLCSRNKLRSPTAETVFSVYENLEVESAGLNHDAETRVSLEMIESADLIFVMEKKHKIRLAKLFGQSLKSKRVICLDIADKYDFMDAELVEILERKVNAVLGT